MDSKEIYLDHIAAAPVRSEVVETMIPLLEEGFGNPQSVHGRGQRAAEVLAAARERVAGLVGADSAEVVFTATGSEANNLAILGIGRSRKKISNRIVVSAIEHHSILGPAKALTREGFELATLPVDRYGFVSGESLAAELERGAALVSITHANTEIGTIEPIGELASICADRGVPLHTDAWGAAGMIPIEMKALGASALTLAGQNFGGPPGAAALVLVAGTGARPIVTGGIQERGLRAGQENIPAIAGFGLAAELAAADMEERAGRLVPIRDALLSRLPAEIDDLIPTGHPEKRLPGHASVCVEYIEGEGMLLLLDRAGIMAASGSACTSKALKGSHVLEAIGLDAATAQGSLVMTLGPGNTMEDVDRVVDAMKPIVARLREMSPLYKRK
ncbi:MAG TPA: cysteine desulfurase [Candidatus Eisenbacteria bacterium]|uniref:Cysteine desulfurase n=1 Tax=Eiseniibacteriota bacterium TaxID=2212470 RepID=A0A7V2AU47_UNCEI|nr:cysteine desulfurase [Candidatus Eisenbacteria bacterium]